MPDLHFMKGISLFPLIFSCCKGSLIYVFGCKCDWECRAELAEKQLRLIEREKELLDKDQTVSTLREEVTVLFNYNAAVYVLCLAADLLLDVLDESLYSAFLIADVYTYGTHVRKSESCLVATLFLARLQLDLERKLRALLTKEKDKAEEQAALSMGLCTGAFTLP